MKDFDNFDYSHGLLGPFPEDISDKVQSERRGESDGFAIYEVIHKIDNGDRLVPSEKFSYPPTVLKMILVERKPGEFCEIYHEQNFAQELEVEPSYWVEVDSERVLATHDRISGVGNYYSEAYWTFDKDGPIPLDLAVIKDTVEKLLPSNMHVYRGIGFQIETLSYDMGLLQESDAGSWSDWPK